MRARGRKVERGAAAVEFALLLPLLMVILLGTIDWGYYFFVEQVVTNAAREGARVGSLTPAGTATADATSASDAQTAAQSYLTAGGLDGAKATVTVNAVAPGPSIQVTVSYPTGSITGFTVLAALMPAQAQAQSIMRR